jgi:hypothetical protein
MKYFVAAVVVVAAVALSGAASAYPTLQGATGLVTVPTAELMPAMQSDVAYDFASTSYLGEDSDLHVFRVAHGMSDTAELYGAWASVSDHLVDTAYALGGKFILPQTYGTKGKWALGGDWQKATDDVDVRVLRAYLTGSFEIPKGRLHAGLMYIDRDWKDHGTESAIRPFLGAELFTPDGATLAGEVRFRDSDIDDKAVFSVVYRHSFPNSNWAGEIGFTNGAALGLGADDTDFFIGVKGRFGGK